MFVNCETKSAFSNCPPAHCSRADKPLEVVRALVLRPRELLLRRWNWKAALFSSLCRGAIFFVANLRSGAEAALSALALEFAYRAVTAGFYAAITQAFSTAEPRWAATLTALVILPLLAHTLEFFVHLLHGTPNLRDSIIASALFTVLTTLFNLYAMRRGVLVVGGRAQPLLADMKMLPGVIFGFAAAGPRFVWRRMRGRRRS